jgi:plasmid stabilization system protein ParE
MTPSDAGSATSDGLAGELERLLHNRDAGNSARWNKMLAAWASRNAPTILAALRPAQPAAVEVEALVALDELDGSDFEAIRAHSKTLRAALSASAAEVEALRGAIRSALAHIKRGRDMVPDDDERLASDVFARAINHADSDLRAALTSPDGGRKNTEICENCHGSGFGVAGTTCSKCNGSGGVLL